jgi:hypothetical protein
MEDICIKNMNRFTISFIILVGLLFVGIVILIYPTSFAPRLTTSQMSPPTQPLAGTIVPREIIMIGSALTITGLVGLAILGFRIFKESEHGEIRK